MYNEKLRKMELQLEVYTLKKDKYYILWEIKNEELDIEIKKSTDTNKIKQLRKKKTKYYTKRAEYESKEKDQKEKIKKYSEQGKAKIISKFLLNS